MMQGMKRTISFAIALGMGGTVAAAALAQGYPTARPYPGVDTPVVRAPEAQQPRSAPTGPVRSYSRAAPQQGLPDAMPDPVGVNLLGRSARDAANWEIGPIIRGRNYSVNMPLRPSNARSGQPGAWSFEFPGPRKSDGHVHYVTMPVRSLEDARRITLTYRIDAAPGVTFHPQEQPSTRATISLYFQQRGDNWSARDGYRTARWYSPSERVMPITPGTHTISIGMDENWAAVTAFKRETAPREFARALANAQRVGFTFGGGGGRGHGVYASGPARFTLLDFRVE